MDKKSKKARPIDPENQYLFDNEFAVGSMTECTGLIPNAPTDDDDTQSYSEIYDVPLPQIHDEHWKSPFGAVFGFTFIKYKFWLFRLNVISSNDG